MQIKPFFKKYEEISRTPIIKDDRGVQYSLVNFVATVVEEPKNPNLNYEHVQFKNPETNDIAVNRFLGDRTFSITTEYKGYVVMSDNLTTYSNGATAYDEVLYWKQPKKLEIIKLDGVTLIETFEGQNSFFQNEFPTMNTKFHVIYNANER